MTWKPGKLLNLSSFQVFFGCEDGEDSKSSLEGMGDSEEGDSGQKIEQGVLKKLNERLNLEGQILDKQGWNGWD